MLLNLGGLESPKPECQVGRAARAQTDLTTPAAHHGLQALRGEPHAFRDSFRSEFCTERFDSNRVCMTPSLGYPAEGSLRGNAGVGQLFEFRASTGRGASLLFEGRAIHTALL